jgi:RNA polymerase sigma-70 factor (ECF subfamily)
MTTTLEAFGEGWQAAHARWDGQEGGFAAFCDHLRTLEVTDAAQPHADDLAFAWACGRGHAAALRAFEDTLVPVAKRAIARVDTDPGFVDDCLQQLRTRLLMPDAERPPRVLGYGGRGPLSGWVSVAAVRVALSIIRATKRQAARDEALWSEAVLFPSGLSPDLQHLKQRYAPQLGEGLRRACAELEERDRAVLRLYFAEGLNIDKIGKIYGVHRATVARWIARTKTTLVERMHAIMHEEQGIALEELSSIDRLVRSQLEISLAGLLG